MFDDHQNPRDAKSPMGLDVDVDGLFERSAEVKAARKRGSDSPSASGVHEALLSSLGHDARRLLFDPDADVTDRAERMGSSVAGAAHDAPLAAELHGELDARHEEHMAVTESLVHGDLTTPARDWARSSYEIGAIFAAIAAVQYVVIGGFGGIDVQPHPYWVLLLPIAALRGLASGLTAATCASALYAAGVLAGGQVENAAALLDIGVLFEPLLFYIVSYVLGEIRDRQVWRNEELTARLEEIEREASRRNRETRTLRSANRELRRRLFDNPADFESVLHAVSRSEGLSDTSDFDVPLRLAEERCGVTKCSVLLVLRDGSVDLARHRGWTADEIRERIEDANASVLVQRAIAEAVPLHSFHSGSGQPTRGPLLVAPIMDSAGVVKALLCLDDIPPRRLQSTTIQVFISISTWAASSLRSTPDEQLPDDLHAAIRKVLGGDRGVGTPEQLAHRLLVEDSRATRQGISSSLLALHAVDLEARVPGTLEKLDRFLLSRACSGLRLADDLYRFGYPGYYVLLLTGTPAAGAEVVRDRLAERLASEAREDFGAIEVAAYSTDVDVTKLVDLLDPIAQNYYAEIGLPDDFRCPIHIPKMIKHGDAVEFAARLRVELGIALRFGQELSLIDFRSVDPGTDAGSMVARHLDNLPVNVLRFSDGVYVLDRQRCVVLMADTDCLSATKVWQRLLSQLESTIPESRFRRIQSDFLALDGSEAQLLVEHFLGDTGKDEGALLSDAELNQLEFSLSELEEFTQGGFMDALQDEVAAAAAESSPFDDPELQGEAGVPADPLAADLVSDSASDVSEGEINGDVQIWGEPLIDEPATRAAAEPGPVVTAPSVGEEMARAVASSDQSTREHEVLVRIARTVGATLEHLVEAEGRVPPAVSLKKVKRVLLELARACLQIQESEE